MTLLLEHVPGTHLRVTALMMTRVHGSRRMFEVKCERAFIAPYTVVVATRSGGPVDNQNVVAFFRNGEQFAFGDDRGSPLWYREGQSSGPITCANGDVIRVELPFDVTGEEAVGDVAIMGHVSVEGAPPSIDDLIGRSSLGSPEALAMRGLADPETVKKALARADLVTAAHCVLPPFLPTSSKKKP